MLHTSPRREKSQMKSAKTPRERAEALISLLVSDWRPAPRHVLWAIRIAIVVSLLVAIGYSYGITLWDWIKLLIVPAVIAGGGLWFNRQQQERQHAHETFLQEEKSRDEFLNAIAEPRVLAYAALWEICKQVRFANNEKITDEKREEYDKQLGEWYWNDGGAMFLSWTASRRLMEARNRLRIKKYEEAEKETQDIKKAFSTLRTELKYDCGIISSKEKDDNIGDLQNWDLGADEKT
jgi:hypothetical protein